MKYEVVFYADSRGKSPVWEFLEDLRKRQQTDKTARIELGQVMLQIELLELLGRQCNSKVTKKLEGDIWELRPGSNRIIYYYNDGKTFVLLHHFRKKTNKTPSREIERAKREIEDYISRGGK